MCGIAGFLTVRGEDTRAPLEAMAACLHHRGPNDEGYYYNKGLGLAHKRLSIIDLNTGHQPIVSEDENYVIVYNGEVYNYFELRQELIHRGYKFTTSTDTEVVLSAYREWGTDCLNKFNGMFAFAIYDKRANTLLLARDRVGIKPLYYYTDGARLLFASEIKALLKTDIPPRRANGEGVQDYITFQFCLGDKTLFEGIHKVQPGHYMTVDLASLATETVQYWDMDFTIDEYHTEDYFVDRLKFLVEDATRIRLRADVPVGAYLSGGLDSSAVACIASDLLSGSLATFTGRFAEGEAYDESAYAKIVSEAAHTQYHEITMTAAQFRDSIEDIIYCLDEPGAGPGVFPQYLVSKLAADNVKVALGGQGGDEIFIGYARYLVAYLEECLKGAIYETGGDKYAVNLESIAPNLPLLQKYRPMLQGFWKDGLFGSQAERYFRLVDRSAGMKELFNPDVMAGGYSPYESYLQIFEGRSDVKSYVNKMTYFDLKASLPALLHVEDRTSMAASLESRLPLLDYRIVELFASIPPNVKFQGGRSKALFKKAVRNIVPKPVLQRKDKMGFPVPLVEWYNGDLKDYVHEILLSERTRQRGLYDTAAIEKLLANEAQFSRVTWGLLCLELWHRTFIDG